MTDRVPGDNAMRERAKALIAELRRGDYTLRRSEEDQAAFDSSWEVRIMHALAAERKLALEEALTACLTEETKGAEHVRRFNGQPRRVDQDAEKTRQTCTQNAGCLSACATRTGPAPSYWRS